MILNSVCGGANCTKGIHELSKTLNPLEAIVWGAVEAARLKEKKSAGIGEFFTSLMSSKKVQELLKSCKIGVEELSQLNLDDPSIDLDSCTSSEDIGVDKKMLSYLARAHKHAEMRKSDTTTELDLFYSILCEPENTDAKRVRQKVSPGDVTDFLMYQYPMSPPHLNNIPLGIFLKSRSSETTSESSENTNKVTRLLGVRFDAPFNAEFPYISRVAKLDIAPGDPIYDRIVQPVRKSFATTLERVKQETIRDFGRIEENVQLIFPKSDITLKFPELTGLKFDIELEPTGKVGASLSQSFDGKYRIVFDDEFPLYFYQAAKLFVELIVINPFEPRTGFRTSIGSVARNVFLNVRFRAGMMELMVADLRFGSTYFRRPTNSKSATLSALCDFFVYGFEQYAISHEIGHAALGHLQKQERMDAHEMEFEADDFAYSFIFLKELIGSGDMFAAIRDRNGKTSRDFGLISFLPCFFWGSVLYFITFRRALLGLRGEDLVRKSSPSHPSIGDRVVRSLYILSESNVAVDVKKDSGIYLRFLENIQQIATEDCNFLMSNNTIIPKEIHRKYYL